MLTRIRSAITGRFVRPSTGRLHPQTTVAEPVVARTGLELRCAALVAAADAVASGDHVVTDGTIKVNAVALGRLQAAANAARVPARRS